MTYAATRDSEQLRILEVAIAEFIQRYTSNPSTDPRRTLILFPGGMACQLLRARTAYRNNVSEPQTFRYDKVWLTLGTFLGDALNLEMHKDNQGVDRDAGNRIIIADGAVELFGITPYDRFTAWCELNGLDWFIFGWDWRRRLEDTAAFFLTQFLPRFRSAVQNACNADPLCDFVLVGHSFGGMIVNLILRQYSLLFAKMTRALTVATPFYGYGGHLHRWFEGEPYLNHLGTLNVIRVITSLPAGYTLPYLDAATYTANRLALAKDPQFALTVYPSLDTSNPAQMVDPYGPGPHRYPGNTGFDMRELEHGLQIYRQLAAPLTQDPSKFFNIRGVKSPPDDTVGSIAWGSLTQPLPGPSPIADGPAVPGDGTQPAWSTRLVELPSAQWVTVQGAIDHIFMMEYDLTHQAIAQVL